MGTPITEEDIKFIEELDFDLLKNYKTIISFIVVTCSFYIILRHF